MPFPIQRIQTDRGREFFAYKVQQRLMEWAIKFRPIKPRSPHLNGKVERSQKTDLQEFWSTVDLKAADLQQQLDEWQHFYNWHRPHTALNGRSPIDSCLRPAVENAPVRRRLRRVRSDQGVNPGPELRDGSEAARIEIVIIQLTNQDTRYIF